MRIIDGHMHLADRPNGWFLRCAQERGYSAYAVLSLSCSAGFGGAINNEQCLQAKREDPRRCYFFAGLVHPCADPLAHIQTWLQRGADGVKLIETKPTVYRETGADLSSPAFEPLFDFLERSQTPILWHVGDPATFWHRDQAPDFAFANGWFYGDGGFPSLEALYGIAEAVLARHPRLKVAFAPLSFCGDDRAHAQRLLDRYPNVSLDLTPGVEMYDHFFADREGWRAFFLRYQDRIQLGTDTELGGDILGQTPLTLVLGGLGEGPVDQWGHKGLGLALPADVLDKICYRNFLAFAGEAPKPL